MSEGESPSDIVAKGGSYMDLFEDKRPVLERKSYDIVVVGGGIAGIAAAVAAARKGVSVLLLEKSIVLGGLATAGLISWYEPLCDGKGKQMIFGIGEELIRLSIKDAFDDLDPAWKTRSGIPEKRFATHYSPTVFAMVLDEYLNDNHVDIMLDSHAVYPVMNGNTCCGVMVESKSGREFYPSKAVIDATGDAEIMDRAGVPTVDGKNWFSFVAHYVSRDTAKRYADNGDMAKFRKWMWIGSDLAGNGQREGLERMVGTTASEITRFVLEGRRAALQKLRQEPREERDLTMLPFMPQFRTIRRIEGKTLFRGVDGACFADNIGDCGDFRHRGRHYQIPYGALYHQAFPNLWAAGRIICAEEGDGWEVSRVIPVCALTGEAAGKAAALCVKQDKKLCELDENDIAEIAIK